MPDEDNTLIEAIRCQAGEKKIKWKLVSDRLSRTCKQCRERYTQHFAPSINKGPWTEDEDVLLFKLQSEVGNAWSKIASMMHGRTEIDGIQ